MFFRRPFAYLGPAALIGVALPEGDAIAATIALFSLLGLSFVRRRTAPLGLAVAALLAGHLARTLRPVGGPLDPVIQGTVARSQGTWVVIDTPSGRAALAWPDAEPPAAHDVVSVYTVPGGEPRDRLPGDPRFVDDDLGRAEVRRAIAGEVFRRPGSSEIDWATGAANAPLLRALTVGDRRGLSSADRRLLAETGTTHLLSVSGLHVGFVAAIAWAIAWPLSRVLGLRAGPWVRAIPPVAAAVGAVAFTIYVGSPAPAVRAAWMVSLGGGIVAAGRPVDAWNLWGLAMLATCLMEPGAVATLSFQLSYAALGGILASAHAARRLLPPDTPRPLRWLALSFGTSIGATLGTLPWAMLVFQSLAPTSPFANLVAVPLSGVIVPLALVARFSSGVVREVTLTIADTLAGLLVAWLDLVRAPVLPIAVPSLASAAILLVTPFLVRRPGALLAVLLVSQLRRFPLRVLTVTFLSVGQGDAAIVEWPDGRRWLVDGGPPSTAVLAYLRRRGIDRLDVVALSHPHPDHLGGLLAVLEALEVAELWVPRRPRPDELDFRSAWLSAFEQETRIRFPDEIEEAQHPLFGWTSASRSDVNDESLVLRLVYGDHSFLLTGDVEAAGERWLTPFALPTTVVKVPHHGSKTSSSAPFVAAVDAEWAVISCGSDNRFGHPAPVTVARWARSRILRTDRDGTVQFTSDGASIRLDRLR